MRIKLSTTLRWPIERQIPADWEEQGIQVFINQDVHECDAWVVYQALHRPESTNVPPERTFFFGYEPPGLHCYQQKFIDQFATVVSCQQIEHPNLIKRHQAQPWLAGVTRNSTENIHAGFGYHLDHEELNRMARPHKPNILSAVCSNKQMIAGHAKRLEFVKLLQRQVDTQCDLFGYGFQPLGDKWEALAPYQYHLVLENSCVADYWTEKLADAFLAWCVPIVWGCPNLADYFPLESFIMLDPDDLEGSLQIVKDSTAIPPSATQQAAVAEARRLILENYNLFSEIRTLVNNTPAGKPQRVRLKDERLFLPGGLLRTVGRALTDRWRASAH